MKKIKVVIGANYGDEGKGLMSDYFVSNALRKQGKCIVACSNGGSQRGHTVVTPEGRRHIFHHFGSGTYFQADTYLSEEYMINPLVFRTEYEELEKEGFSPKVYVHRNCRWSTPFDMFVNQIVEESRGNKRHGSCGYGIWETIVRYEKIFWTLEELKAMTDEEFKSILLKIRNDYLRERLWELGVEQISREWETLIGSEELLEIFMKDIRFLFDHIVLTDNEILKEYTDIIFENGQGLLLDQNILEHNEHTTPSNTGLQNPGKVIKETFADEEIDVEVCYVTRTYLTRHGAGPLPSECEKSEINGEMVDRTNVPNPHQGTLRYGILKGGELIERTRSDFHNFSVKSMKHGKWEISLAVTHINEYGMHFSPASSYHKVYISDAEDRNSVKELKYY